MAILIRRFPCTTPLLTMSPSVRAGTTAVVSYWKLTSTTSPEVSGLT